MQAFVKVHNWLRNSASVLPYGNTEASNSPRLRVVVSLTGIASGQDHSLTRKLYEPPSGSYVYHVQQPRLLEQLSPRLSGNGLA